MEINKVLRICILVLTLVFTMSIINATWWDSNFAYRQNISILANENTQTNYQILLQLNSSNLGSNFDWSNNCEDIRFIHSGSSLDYWIQDCDTTNQKIFVWVETDTAISNGNNYDIMLYYNNPAALDQSSASNTFRANSIHLINGRCTDATYCNGMDSHTETDYIKTQIGTAPFTIDGSGYVTGVNDVTNPWGTQDYYYSRYRFLFIPTTGGNYDFGTNSDDGSEITLFPYDSFGDGITTNHLFGAHDVVGFWYGLHGTGTCGTSGTRYTRALTAGKGYWFDYIMNEWGGGQLAQMCMRNGATYNIVNTGNFANQLFAREYVANEPTIDNIDSEETFAYLQLTVTNPSPLAVQYVLQNKEFDFDVTVLCIAATGESCGTVTSYARQNSSGSFTNIATSSTTPMWTSSSQGQTCVLDEGDSCNLNFKINATGNVGDYYFANLLSQSSIPNVIDVISKNISIRIIDTNIVSFNQTIFDFGNFTKGTGDKTATLKIESNIGDNNNIVVNCESGDCSTITENWIDGTNLLEGNSQNIIFTCSDDFSGSYTAIFNVTSAGNPYSSKVEINCEVLPIYGPILVTLNNPIPLGNISVRQNKTFIINASVNCVGICGEISAYAIFKKSDWWNSAWSYKRNVTITTTVNTGNNYQVLLRLDNSDLGSNFDWSNSCQDVRFVHEGNLIDYWIENCDEVGEQLDVWIETDEAITTVDPYEVEIYYGNLAAISLSSADDTFRQDEIFEIAGRCPTTNSNCNMDNHAEANAIRAGIGTGVFTVDGSGYNTEINMADNPYGTNDYFYLRYRWLFIPDTNGTYRFGSKSDDSSEITIFPFDGYGGGIRTTTPYGAHDVITYLYAGWHNNYDCGSTTLFTINGRNFIAGKGYWLDYTMQEGGGGEDAIACTSIDSTVVTDYNLLNVANFPNQIYARNYVTPEPIVGSVGTEDNLLISTINGDIPLYTFNTQPQTCTPVEDGSCSFEWLVNATGLVNTSYDVSVIFNSDLSQIQTNITLSSKVIITDFIVPTVTLISPTDGMKNIVNGNSSLIWQVDDDSILLNCSLYINGIFNRTEICSNSGNNSISLDLDRGYYNWSIVANDSEGNVVNSVVWDFYIIKNISKTAQKSIKYENLNLYKIGIIVKDLTSQNLFGTLIEWVANGLVSGSKSPLEDWNEIVSSGEYIGWEGESNVNHSIAGTPGYSVRKSYVIGLD